ncbi:MAG: hypothetical protein MI740_11145 [Halanaerobiales bacterium]|nr:hypothetical protein [Halanaerobiales bacterium]
MLNLKNNIVIIIIILPAIYFGYIGKSTEMGLAIVAGAIVAAFINIDKIQRFKGAGFEAEMRKMVEEGYATIENLKELGKPIIKALFVNITHFNNIGSMALHKKHEVLDDLKQILKRLFLKDKELMEIISVFP